MMARYDGEALAVGCFNGRKKFCYSSFFSDLILSYSPLVARVFKREKGNKRDCIFFFLFIC